MKCPFCIKVCSKCNRILVACEVNFHKQKGGKYSLQAKCKECRNERKRQWNKNNVEHQRQYYKKWYQDNTEHKREYDKQWRKDNAEHKRELDKQWRQDNPEKVLNYRFKYRSGLESNITREQYDELLSFFDNKCAYSGESFNDNLSIDHIIPLEAGGTNDIYNLVPCCSLYNCCKLSNDLLMWYMNQPFYSKDRLNKILAWVTYAKNKWN